MLEGIRPYFFCTDIFQNYFSLLGVVPEIGLLGYKFFVTYFKALTIVVKDTSSRR
jgi:hypothetical protein